MNFSEVPTLIHYVWNLGLLMVSPISLIFLLMRYALIFLNVALGEWYNGKGLHGLSWYFPTLHSWRPW